MFEFRWHVSDEPSEDVVLRIDSSSGWLGRKLLTWGGREIFRRGWFTGIDAQFRDPRTARELHLRMAKIPGSADWRPALFCGNEELPEATGARPPHVVNPPRAITLTFGFTYLMMLLAVVTFPSTAKILGALHKNDANYVISQDTLPWLIPFAVTAVCLLGLLNMRKWAVGVFGGLIVLQAVLSATVSLPVSIVALALQVLLWLVGAAHWGKMR